MSYIIAIGHRVLIGWLCMEMEVEKRDQAVTRDMESRYYPWIMVGYQEPGYLTTPRRMLRTSYPRRMLRTSYQPILPITIPTKLTTRPHARPPIMPPITNLPYKPNPALGQPMCPAYIQPDDERLGWQCRKMCLLATPLKRQTFLSVADMSEMSS